MFLKISKSFLKQILFYFFQFFIIVFFLPDCLQIALTRKCLLVGTRKFHEEQFLLHVFFTFEQPSIKCKKRVFLKVLELLRDAFTQKDLKKFLEVYNKYILAQLWDFFDAYLLLPFYGVSKFSKSFQGHSCCQKNLKKYGYSYLRSWDPLLPTKFCFNRMKNAPSE